ncbi:hypothetical protein FHS31_003057 [Sphingomonas vulcanisoli]|uniref:Phytanoyl-CoA dioxygenase n=1 Tax=Sphingomonas vulcanisoli TaxID=1658060 RepID=A0ABX0TYC9_9SPHN|nr:phytanoyl-CoA dioxygenase family protein [Sphingomonas vulcanisoli]NIJ09425.1 hypothetical protein [Sphingomonas vulcanisoli]
MSNSARVNPLRLLLGPLWVLQLFTGAKAFSDNPIIGSRRLNRWGLHAFRVRLAEGMADERRKRLTTLVSAKDAAAFARDGFVCVRDFLPAQVFAGLRDQVMAYEGPARETWQGDTITRRYAIDNAALEAIPTLRDLLDDRRWQGLLHFIASDRSQPLLYIQTILSHRFDADPDPQTKLHADTFHPTMKAWFFLTDVAEDQGPFTYVPGSHRATPARIAWEKQKSIVGPDLERLSARGSLRIEESELATLGLPAPSAFAVPGNTLVVADTHGFHARGPSVRPSVRVEIFAYGRRSPFLPWTGLNLLSLPGIAERRLPFFWWISDRFPKLLRRAWVPAGLKRPADP